MDISEVSPLALAFFGDAVYEIYVREQLIKNGVGKPDALHKAAAKLVCASYQAAAARKIEPMLTEEEADILRRGRNAHSVKAPKNADVIEYRMATGLEALMGYLELCGRHGRVTELMDVIVCSEGTK